MGSPDSLSAPVSSLGSLLRAFSGLSTETPGHSSLLDTPSCLSPRVPEQAENKPWALHYGSASGVTERQIHRYSQLWSMFK